MQGPGALASSIIHLSCCTRAKLLATDPLYTHLTASVNAISFSVCFSADSLTVLHDLQITSPTLLSLSQAGVLMPVLLGTCFVYPSLFLKVPSIFLSRIYTASDREALTNLYVLSTYYRSGSEKERHSLGGLNNRGVFSQFCRLEMLHHGVG